MAIRDLQLEVCILLLYIYYLLPRQFHAVAISGLPGQSLDETGRTTTNYGNLHK